LLAPHAQTDKGDIGILQTITGRDCSFIWHLLFIFAKWFELIMNFTAVLLYVQFSPKCSFIWRLDLQINGGLMYFSNNEGIIFRDCISARMSLYKTGIQVVYELQAKAK
jgi:hypothetical protein